MPEHDPDLVADLMATIEALLQRNAELKRERDEALEMVEEREAENV